VTGRLLDWGDRTLEELSASADDAPEEVTLPAPGAYYLAVRGRDGSAEAVAYRLYLDLAYSGATPTLLYRNTFHAPSDADWIEVPSGATWHYGIVDGGLRVAPISPGTLGTSFRGWPASYGDLTMTVDGLIEEGWVDDGDTGLLIGVRDRPRTPDEAGPSDSYDVDVEAGGRTILSLRQYDVRQWLASPIPPPRPIGPGETVRVTVRAQGDEIEVFLDGTSVARARDATFGAGRITLGAYTNGPTIRVRFDDLLVTTPTTGQISGPLGPGIDRSPGAVLFADDFDDPAHSRLKASRVPGPVDRSFVEGEFAIRIVDPTWPNLPVIAPPVISSSAVMQVDARVVGDTPGRYIAFSCRDQNLQNTSQYRFSIDPTSGQFSIDWWDASTPISRVRWTSSDAIRRGNATNTYELGCGGTTIFARINGTEVARVSESALPNGRFTMGGGVFTNRKPATSDIRFDNIVVRQI
jgi:hypothetical protein